MKLVFASNTWWSHELPIYNFVYVFCSLHFTCFLQFFFTDVLMTMNWTYQGISWTSKYNNAFTTSLILHQNIPEFSKIWHYCVVHMIASILLILTRVLKVILWSISLVLDMRHWDLYFFGFFSSLKIFVQTNLFYPGKISPLSTNCTKQLQCPWRSDAIMTKKINKSAHQNL